MDEVYMSLLAESDTDPLCKKILELMCASFAKLGERMLCDHLEGGKFWNVEDDVKHEMMSVPTTNVGVERDFGMLDRLMREKPNASTLALEGLIMWQENKTGKWRDELNEEMRAKYMRIARESMNEQRRLYFERRKAIKEVRAMRWAEKRERAVAKVERERERMVSLSNELKQVGGLWSSVSELEERLSALADEKEKCDALKVQLKYWKWVLKAKNKDGILNLSVAGKPKRFNDLLDSLKEVIQQQNHSFQGSLPDTSGVSGVTDGEDVTGSTLSLAKLGTKRRIGGDSLRVVPSSHNQKPLVDVKNLVGRVIKHCFEEEGVDVWYMGVVTKKLGKRLYIRYDSDKDNNGWYFDSETILEDYGRGDLYEITDLLNLNAVGRRVKHMWLDENTDEEDWWCGSVLSVKENEVVIEYDEVYVEDEDDSEEYEDERVTFPLEELQQAYLSRELLFL
ncbi:hypothetical protein HOLleu_04314 [Holothuria leucospilota]|nr:hypothetical protein HOLleu_04314 [Holothuria leucospilota]